MGDHDLRSKIQHRAENKAESLCYTYKQHFAAANFYRFVAKVIDTVVFGAASLILATYFWNAMPNQYIIIPAVLIAGLTGVRRALDLDAKPGEFRRSAQQYHALFDEYRDFLTIRLRADTVSVGELQQEFERLSSERRRLNQNTPDANGLWYRYIRWKGEERIREEITTKPETREVLSGDYMRDLAGED